MHMLTNTAPAPARTAVLRRRIRWIVAFTIVYNIAEAIIALFAGSIASSSALIGFGLDSLVEVGSAAAVAWQFAAPDPRTRERLTLRLIAAAFFALALLVTVDAMRALVGGDQAAHSPVGIGLAAVSVTLMPLVAWFERRTGRELGSPTAIADSRQLILCTYLSAALLIGLLLNAWLDWWWADPVAAVVIAGLAVREGINTWQGDACCTTSGALLRGDESVHADDCCAKDA